MRRISMRCRVAVTVAVAALLGGCGRGGVAPTEKAEAALNKVLDAWTRGEAAGKYAGPEQPIQVTDPDWEAGQRLMSFLTAESKPDPQKPNLVHCRVSLSLRDAQGEEADREVVYDVQLGDRIAIQRARME